MNKIFSCILFLLFLLLGSNTIFGQLRPAILWQKCLGGTAEDKANDVIINPDGSMIVAGFSKSNDGDVTGHHGSTSLADAWVVKLDSSGNILWQKSIGGTGEDIFNTIIATNDDGYLCVGSTNSDDGDINGNHGGTDALIVKIDAAGNIVWSKCYGTAGFDIAQDATLTADNGYAIVGTSYGTGSFPQSWAFKINAPGDVMWENYLTIGGPGNLDFLVAGGIGYGIIQSEDNNLYALVTAREYYDGNTASPEYDTVFKSPGYIFKLDNLSGTPAHIATLQGDSSYAMCRGLTATYFSLINESFFSPEGCFEEQLLSAVKTDGSAAISYTAISNLSNCTDYSFLYLPRFTRTHGIAIDPSSATLVGAGSVDKGPLYPLPQPTNAYFYLKDINLRSTYGGDLSPSGFTSTDAFNSVKVFPGGSDYIAAGNTNSIDGDVTGLHGTNAAASDCWIVRLQSLNKITGNVFVDDNNNGIKDPGELPFTSAIVKSTKAGFEQSSIPYHGTYRNTVATGTFTTTISINRPYYTATPASKTSVFTTYKNVDTANFAVHPIPGIQDYTIGMASLLPARPGFNLQYNVAYTNNGTTTLTNKNIIFVKDSRTQFLGALPANTSINGDTIKWNIVNLLPMAGGNIIINLQLATVPTVNNGDVIIDKVLIDSAGDFQPIDNFVVLNETVSGSYDPNDKRESFGGEIYPPDIASGKYLNYTIRFQNSGTDTAFNIILKDTLDPKLNADSIEVIASSHAYNVNIRDKKYLTVTFSNIKLVDSIHNEPLSHGYFSYRIKPLATVVVGDTIRNNASICFDFNPPIKTNTEITFVRPTPTTNLWTGAVSTAWEDPLNWGNHLVPDENTNVIINTGLPRYPIINSNALCKSLVAKTGVNVLVKNGFTLKVTH